jgi:hypothetical protein
MHRPHVRLSWQANIVNLLIRLVIFLVLFALAISVYQALLDDILKGASHFWAFILLWLFTAYIILPRINRRLSRIYLPNYFIGRAQTSDGLLGDPINMALYGTEAQLVAAMKAAGWSQADDLGVRSSTKIALTSVIGKPYPTAPVSPLYLFGNKQQLAFEKQYGGNPRKRHHVRFWATPPDWWLPGGYQVDWLGAATFDSNIGLSLFTGQITHRIDADVDKERDFVIGNLHEAGAVAKSHVVEHFTTSYHSRNGGGDAIHTDGSLPFVTLR